MSRVSRRRFLVGGAAAGGALAVGGGSSVATAGGVSSRRRGAAAAERQAQVITARDGQYTDLVRGTNQRFVGTPDRVVVTSTADQVTQAVQEAVSAGLRPAVRSGGHCYEDYVAHSSVGVVIDVSEMNDVSYDPEHRALAVEPGATVLETNEPLYKRWGVALPAGSCPTVGMGGHVVGGGYGPRLRSDGLIVDHLWGVEVVVVDGDGRARRVLATREPDDPNRDLWWAHTGGGGGNFGVVTRFLFRSPGASGDDPRELLPRPPSELVVSQGTWSWDGLDEDAFQRIMGNWYGFFTENSDPNSPYARLFSQIRPQNRAAGSFGMGAQIDGSVDGAEGLLDDFLAAVNDGVKIPFQLSDKRRVPWMKGLQWPGFTGGGDLTTRFKAKSAFVRRGIPERQLSAMHRHLSSPDYAYPGALVIITSRGGRTGAVAPDATALAQRDSLSTLHYVSYWTDPAQDSWHLDWIRGFYQDVYADTGGVPIPNEVTDGAYVNYCDADLGDPDWNTSGVSWQELYYGANHPRLQAVKGRWDPLNTFRHSQSVTAD